MTTVGPPFPDRARPSAALSLSTDLSFRQVTTMLSSSPLIEGVLLVGSAATNRLSPESDYDLVVILSPDAPHVQYGITYVDHRLTDLMFFSRNEVQEFLGLESPVSADARLGALVLWLEQGDIVIDRFGLLTRAQEKAREATWLLGPEDLEAYRAWNSINFNLRHNRRMLRSDDPIYHRALAVRMLYCVHDVLMGWFRVRGLPNRGEKHAIRHLEEHDPAFLRLFEATVGEPVTEQKVALYEKLAAMALAPFGGLWEGEVTVMNAADGADWEAELSDFVTFWQGILKIDLHSVASTRLDLNAGGSGWQTSPTL